MSEQKGKSQNNPQRSTSLNRSNSNSGNKKQNIEERKNDIKRKLLEQMQADLRLHPEGQAKTYEALDNAKKLKKMLVDTLYTNRNPLSNLIHDHHQQNSSSNNINTIKNNNSNSNQECSTGNLKVVKTTQQFQNGNNKYKQRSSSVQKEYSTQSSSSQRQPQYSHLNCIPNDSQSRSHHTSYRQMYNDVNNQHLGQQQQHQEQNDLINLTSKKQVTFTDPSIKSIQSGKSSPAHQCFHKEGCSKHSKSNCNQNSNNKSCKIQEVDNENQELQNESNRNTIIQNSKQLQNIDKQFNDREQKLLDKNESDQLDQKNHLLKNTQKIQNSLKPDGSAPNSPSLYGKSSQKQARSQSASNSGKKSEYKNLIESEEEKQEIFKKIQNQKQQMVVEGIERKTSQSGRKENQTKEKVNAASRKPPQNPQPQSQQSSQSQLKNRIASDNMQKQTFKQQVGDRKNEQSAKDTRETLQKQRSVSTQQYSNSTTLKTNINDKSSKLIDDKGKKHVEVGNNNQLNKSFENENQQREQKIIDLQRLIERMKIENNSKLSKLEIKKLEEQVEKDTLYEKQMLDLKLQQKNIFILQQENDLIQEQSDSFENKFKQIQSKNKHFEKIRLELEDEIQRQILNIQELRGQINNNKSQYNELNRRYNILKKQYDDLENEKNKINSQKMKSEQDQQQKNNQFQCLNKQNFDLTIEFERKNKEQLYQINQLIEKLNDMTKKYDESSKSLSIFQNKFKIESQSKEQLRVELKLIQAQVSENEELKRKIKQKDNKLEELESVVDDLKRKIRNNLNIDMNHQQNRQMIEKIVEKPIFIEKKVEVEKSSHNSNIVQEYKAQILKCQDDFSEIKHKLMIEQELHHQKLLECETWKSHAYSLEDKLNGQINQLKQNFDMERNMFDKEIRDKEMHISDLKSKINTLLQEIEILTHKNIDKNRQIANEIINSNNVLSINEAYHQIPNYLGTSQNTNNQSYLSYIHG